MMNKIYTNAEYMAQGFTADECPRIRRHDELYNKWIAQGLTVAEDEELNKLVKELGL
jgi:hypothetical protein